MVKREELDVNELVSEMFPKILVKDLHENEQICPHCKGLGMVIGDNVYGIIGDTSEAGKKTHFPYKRQALSFCPHCYNGVQKLCPHCHQPYKNRGIYRCDCDGYKREKEEKERIEWDEVISKAKCIDESDANTMLYLNECDEYFDSTDDFFEWWNAEYGDEDGLDRPVRLWVTEKIEMCIDAGNVIESACECLHEDASDQCDYNSLQKLLDDWCADQTGTSTYYPCFKEYVMIDWSEYL